MKRLLFSFLCLFFITPAFTQTKLDKETIYALTLIGMEIPDIGSDSVKANYADSCFTMIGPSLLHIKGTITDSQRWRAFYYARIFKEKYNTDITNMTTLDTYEFLKDYTVGNYRDAKNRYASFCDTRIKNLNEYKKYMEAVGNLLTSIHNSGSEEKSFLLSSFNSPIYFTYTGNKQLTVFANVISPSIMNIRKPSDTRLRYILLEEVVPILKCFQGKFDSGIKYYALAYSFVSDVLNDAGDEVIGETVTVVVPTNVVTDYSNLLITKNELLEKCDIYHAESKSKEVGKIDFRSLMMQ